MQSKLNIAVEPVAALRRLGNSNAPTTVSVALLAELGGTSWVQYDLRGEHRVENERDARLLRASLNTSLDLVLATGPELLDLAFSIRPERLTLAPERRIGSASMDTLDAQTNRDVLRKQILHIKDTGIDVAVRIDAELEQVKALHYAEAATAVLSAHAYTTARGSAHREQERVRLGDAAALAHRLKLNVAVSGDLTLDHVEALARIPHVSEFQVGHACLARAVLRGMETAVGDFRRAMQRGRPQVG